MNCLLIREAKPGEPSLVVHFYYKLFEQQFGFLPSTEKYFLHAMTELFDDQDGNKLWVIEEAGEIKGSICIVKKGNAEAQLRLFGTDISLQGKGAGKQLMQKAMNFCKERGYSHVILWTIDICESACYLYDKFGFRFTESKHNTTWANYLMTEEKWEYFA
ncbi:Acetyltransferase (GNAT) domain-containing protein [Dethiosulfatibacter aminovorans DSM 17477]|uniref:Acetyltransferase (GNAT) domain-containing protein n=1 Tax=Dethiosulfatibacter aminovorans DSM 17477 TaxID=1121476 RepID=A0A1M6N965_9FIRM|nr:GNAT family N-acetyltransferase [Dethiosulfatibacter aminovorans]SHJ92184.1 Acetyltransferase (GNAT) domain-containing protein [Dethiosulfatibacter aminovorans DSM 17477]